MVCVAQIYNGIHCNDPLDIMKSYKKVGLDVKEKYEPEDEAMLYDIVLVYIMSNRGRARELEEEWMTKILTTGESIFCGMRLNRRNCETNKAFAKLAKTVHELQSELPEPCLKYAQSRMVIFTVIEKCFGDIDTLHKYTEAVESVSMLVREIIFLVAMFFDDEAGDYAHEMLMDNVFVKLIQMYNRLRENRPQIPVTNDTNSDMEDDDDVATEITGYSVPMSLCPGDSDSEDEIYIPATGLKEHFFVYYNNHIRRKVRVRIPDTLISPHSDVHMNLRRMVLYTPFILKTKPREILRIIDCYQILTKDVPQFAGTTALGLCLCFQFMTPTHLRLCCEYTRKALKEYHDKYGAAVI